MKRRNIFILFLVTIFGISATMASNSQHDVFSFGKERISVMAGETFEIPVILENGNAYSAFQCDIVLAEGIEVERDEYGDYSIYPENARMTTSHTMTVKENENGAIRVVCYSSSSKDFKGNDGAIFYIRAKAAKECKGTMVIAIRNIILAKADAQEKRVEDAVTQITVEPYQEEEDYTDVMYMEKM